MKPEDRFGDMSAVYHKVGEWQYEPSGDYYYKRHPDALDGELRVAGELFRMADRNVHAKEYVDRVVAVSRPHPRTPVVVTRRRHPSPHAPRRVA